TAPARRGERRDEHLFLYPSTPLAFCVSSHLRFRPGHTPRLATGPFVYSPRIPFCACSTSFADQRGNADPISSASSRAVRELRIACGCTTGKVTAGMPCLRRSSVH